MTARKLKKIRDVALFEQAMVMAMFELNADFEDKLKLDIEEFKDYKWELTDWDHVVTDVDVEKYICERTCISVEYVDMFRKIVGLMTYTKRMNNQSLDLYESHNINCPVLVTFGGFGAIIAPRVDDNAPEKYGFKPIETEKEKKNDGKPKTSTVKRKRRKSKTRS